MLATRCLSNPCYTIIYQELRILACILECQYTNAILETRDWSLMHPHLLRSYLFLARQSLLDSSISIMPYEQCGCFYFPRKLLKICHTDHKKTSICCKEIMGSNNLTGFEGETCWSLKTNDMAMIRMTLFNFCSCQTERKIGRAHV